MLSAGVMRGNPQDALDRAAGRFLLSSKGKHVAQSWLARPFSGSPKRVLIYYNPSDISWSQFFGFVWFAQDFLQQYDVQFRYLPIGKFLDPQVVLRDADLVFVQPWFTTKADILDEAFDRQKRHAPDVPIDFFDSFAHSDIRLGSIVDPYIRFYVKKSIFKDKSLYKRPFRGDTNLTEFYGDQYGYQAEPVDWQVPDSLISKLHLGANFMTAYRFLGRSRTINDTPHLQRTIDLHARFDSTEDSWYGEMRRQALKHATSIPGVALSPRSRVSYQEYMREMGDCRMCFSPFGYGELCWRDVEAMFCGATLVKQDMSHLKTLPDIYKPDVTYLSVRWDFSDLGNVIRTALLEPDRTQDIARTAQSRLSHYLTSRQFVTDMKFLFE